MYLFIEYLTKNHSAKGLMLIWIGTYIKINLKNKY